MFDTIIFSEQCVYESDKIHMMQCSYVHFLELKLFEKTLLN